MSDKLGVAAALDRLTKYHPELRYAVVYDYDRWHPVQPPPGSEWDYEPFITRELALAALANPRPGMSAQELWELGDDKQWNQVDQP